MSARTRNRCASKYAGASYPHMRGTQCELVAGHDTATGNAGRHYGGHIGAHISWLSAEQKADFDRTPDGPVLP